MDNIGNPSWALKSDLIVSLQNNQEGVFYVIKDPSTAQFFRFKEVEYYIAQQFDGQTSKEIIRHQAEEKFKVSLTPENIDQFITRLSAIGLLVDKNSAPAVVEKTSGNSLGIFSTSDAHSLTPIVFLTGCFRKSNFFSHLHLLFYVQGWFFLR